jgi:ribosomal protein S18 acetylase RimI-like enzyme
MSIENPVEITWREEPLPSDIQSVRDIVLSSGFFSEAEVEIAAELVQERLNKGLPSGYYFLFAERKGNVIGYSCFGPIPCTVESYDVYWIALKNELRGGGLGQLILKRAENKIREMGGKRVYVETSSRDQYKPTQSFYRRYGYREEAVLVDFYARGDHKVIFLKVL